MRFSEKRGSASGIGFGAGFGNLENRLSLALSNWLRNFTASRLALSYAVFLFVALILPVVLGTILVSSDSFAGTDTAGNVNGYYVSVTSANSLDLSVNSVPGGAIASTSDTLSISSNTPNGYKVYISATANTTGANYLCPAGVTPSTSACFVPTTAANTLSDLTTNSWGYSLDGTSYSPVPLFGSGVAIINKTSTTSESSVSKPIHFGVKADMAMPSDTYTGTILYTAIADTSGTTRLTTISPTSTENISGGDTLTVTIPYISSRPEAEIKNATTITIGGTSCPVQAITKITSPYTGIQATCTMPAKSAGTYTVSVAISQAGGGSQGYTASESLEYMAPAPDMQDIASYCPSLATDNTIIMKDSRDGQKYTVFKAKDGNCWMGENLRFGALPETTPTDTPTGRPWNSTTDPSLTNTTSAGATKMADLTYDSTNPATAGRIKVASSGNKTADGNSNAFYSSGDNYTEPYIMIYQANQSATYDGQTPYGVLYNYCAATGGTVCDSAAMSTDAPGSVCPKGWKLPGMTASPTGSGADPSGTTKSYNNLFNAYGVTNDSAGFNKITPSPLSFVRAGFAFGGSLNNRSSSGVGYYWSSTKYSGTLLAYYLYFNSDYVRQNLYSRYNGYSARCVSES